MWTESGNFAHGLGRQQDAKHLTSVDMDRMDTGDLIGVMFEEDGDLALKALQRLKDRYHEERLALSQMYEQWPEGR